MAELEVLTLQRPQPLATEAGIGPSVLGLHLPEVLGLLRTLVHGPSWALRRSAAHGLLEIQASVPSTMVKAEHAAEMGALAARLVDENFDDD